MLLKKKANVNNNADRGTPALSHAIYNNNQEMAKLLLQAGANPFLSDDYSRPVDAAVVQGNKAVLDLIFTTEENKKRFYKDGSGEYLYRGMTRAGAAASPETLIYLDKKGLEVNRPDRDGRTAFHYAAKNGKIHNLEFLAQQEGFDVNKPGFKGETAYELAVKNGQKDAAVLLLMIGANHPQSYQSIFKTLIKPSSGTDSASTIKEIRTSNFFRQLSYVRQRNAISIPDAKEKMDDRELLEKIDSGWLSIISQDNDLLKDLFSTNDLVDAFVRKMLKEESNGCKIDKGNLISFLTKTEESISNSNLRISDKDHQLHQITELINLCK